jgi:hypothetical protein
VRVNVKDQIVESRTAASVSRRLRCFKFLREAQKLEVQNDDKHLAAAGNIRLNCGRHVRGVVEI